MSKLKINLQNQFRWNELPDKDKIEIIEQWKDRIDLPKFCQEYSPAIFTKGINGHWTIKNILQLEL